jgi:phage FluMu protein gp41
MTKLEQIQSTIEKLSTEDIAKLREWLEDLDARLFDDKIAADAQSGKLDKLMDEARANLKAGRGEAF